jgi:signal transduction histidine kinase
MDAFLGMVGHELKTPLTAVKGNLQLAKRRLVASLREPLATSLQQSLEVVQVLLDRAEHQIGVQNRLVSDLLDSTRIQAGQLDLHLEPSDLAGIVREVVEDQRVAVTPRVIALDLPALETVPVLADADRIGQVVSNYLSNALKYAPADRPIVVRLQVNGTNACLCVQDEGPGLSPTEQERIWERFYRVPGVERQPGLGPSLGLGLYICRMIIEQHTGQVGVTSTPGHGSTFWFTLPLTTPDRMTPAASSN